MSLNDSKIAKIQSHFIALTKTASALNAASDELTKVVANLDEALKKLNVGLVVWVKSASLSSENPYGYDQEEIGYCKLNGKWGIALRRIWGDEREDIQNEDGPWLFNDGPREMRLRGVDKIPEVIEQLAKEAFNTTKNIEKKTEEVRELAVAITGIDQLPKTPGLHIVNISQDQVEAIKENTREHQKFVAELLEHAFGWERSNDQLRIRFAFDKSSFAELLKGGATNSLVSGAVNHVLGLPMKLVVAVDPARFPRTADSTKPSAEKGRK